MERRSDEEIVQDIFILIKDAGGAIERGTEAWMIEMGEAYMRSCIVRGEIDGARLLARHPPFEGYQKDNADYLKKIIKWIDDGKKLFAAPPSECIDTMLRLPRPNGDE
jgi:hypothetical protein